MVTLITRPRPEIFKPKTTGAQRAAQREAQKAAALGPVPPTKETRQNFRQFARKAAKIKGASE